MTSPPAPFIVGYARSGTTLLRLMLDAHPTLAIPAETHFLRFKDQFDEAARRGPEALADALVAFDTWPDMAMSRDDLLGAFAAVDPFDLSGALRAFYMTYARTHGKSRWGDKTPDYLTHLEAVREVLPEAAFLHLIRDGRDVAASIRDLWFSPSDRVSVIAADWVERVSTARSAGAGMPRYLEVRYEDLVRDPGSVLPSVCDFLELEYDDRMLDYHLTAAQRLDEFQTQVNSRTGKVTITKQERQAHHELASSPPDASRIGVWRHELSWLDRRRFQRVAGPLLDELGY